MIYDSNCKDHVEILDAYLDAYGVPETLKELAHLAFNEVPFSDVFSMVRAIEHIELKGENHD